MAIEKGCTNAGQGSSGYSFYLDLSYIRKICMRDFGSQYNPGYLGLYYRRVTRVAVSDQRCYPDASLKAEGSIQTLHAVTDLQYGIM